MVNAITKELAFIINKDIGKTLDELDIDLTFNAGEFDNILRHVRVMAPGLKDAIIVELEEFYGPDDAVFDIMEVIRKLDVCRDYYVSNLLGTFLEKTTKNKN